ncbi:MAG: hypothetical protein AB9903_31115 [Vulcanimicrobiota bacterium]
MPSLQMTSMMKEVFKCIASKEHEQRHIHEIPAALNRHYRKPVETPRAGAENPATDYIKEEQGYGYD